jgi:excisionase family DNA binding protein
MTNVVQVESTNKNDLLADFKNILYGFIITEKTTIPENQLLTRNETAKLLSVSLVTLWDWTKKDLIPAYRIGNKVRYKKSEVLESLQKMNKF